MASPAGSGGRRSARSLGAPSEAVAPVWAQGGDTLTTAGGVPVDDTDNSLRVGERGPTLLEDFHLREKIMHFDHERIPERVVHARGAAAHGMFRLTTSIENLTCAPVLCDTAVDTPVFVRFSTVAGLAGLGRHRPRRPRVRGEVLHRRGQLGPGRQQHPGVLHPGRHQVPRPHPRRQAGTGPGDPAGPDRPRHVLGLRLAAPRGHPHVDVDHVRPGHPPLVSDHGGLRRPHLPPGQRRRGHDAGEVPLEAGGRQASPGVGGGPEARRHRPGLPPPRPVGRHRGRRVPGVGPRHPGLPRHRRPDLRGHRPARPDQARPRGARPGAAHRAADPEPQPDQLLRRDRAGRLLHRARAPRDRLHRRPAPAGPDLLLPRHPAHPPGRPELRPAADQPAALAGQHHPARRVRPAGRRRGRRRLQPELAGRRLPVPGRERAATSTSPAP